MAAGGERTEQPTQQRLNKARRDGEFPASKEFVSAVQFMGFLVLLTVFGGSFFVGTLSLMRRLLARAFSIRVSPAALMATLGEVVQRTLLPLLLGGAAVALLVLLTQLASTRFGISFSKLAPDLGRLNPFTRLRNLAAQNIAAFLQSLILIPLIGLVVYYEIKENLDQLLSLPWMTPPGGMLLLTATLKTLLWRAGSLFMILGLVDLFRQHRRFNRQLRMSKQEVREEAKEQQGNPQIKMRIRRLQRDYARRRMMKEVPNATAVIVNPTHYAVAIRYTLDSGSAPKVVAKGKNYLALRIRKKAIEHLVPIVENPPLARALYQSADVGQEIPANLYRAVAEILAYIYRLMNGRLPGQAS